MSGSRHYNGRYHYFGDTTTAGSVFVRTQNGKRLRLAGSPLELEKDFDIETLDLAATPDDALLYWDATLKQWKKLDFTVGELQAPNTNDVMFYNGSKWVVGASSSTPLPNGTGAGQLLWWDTGSGSWKPIPSTLAANQYWVWSGSAFVATTVPTVPPTTFSGDGTVNGEVMRWDNTGSQWVPNGATPAINEVLQWNGTSYVGASLPTTSLPSGTNGQILRNNGSGTWVVSPATYTPATGDILNWNGTEWATLAKTPRPTGSILYWDGSNYIPLDTSTGSDYSFLMKIGGNWSFSPNISAASAGNFYVWNGSAWAVTGLNPTTNHHIYWSGGSWATYALNGNANELLVYNSGQVGRSNIYPALGANRLLWSNGSTWSLGAIAANHGSLCMWDSTLNNYTCANTANMINFDIPVFNGTTYTAINPGAAGLNFGNGNFLGYDTATGGWGNMAHAEWAGSTPTQPPVTGSIPFYNNVTNNYQISNRSNFSASAIPDNGTVMAWDASTGRWRFRAVGGATSTGSMLTWDNAERAYYYINGSQPGHCPVRKYNTVVEFQWPVESVLTNFWWNGEMVWYTGGVTVLPSTPKFTDASPAWTVAALWGKDGVGFTSSTVPRVTCPALAPASAALISINVTVRITGRYTLWYGVAQGRHQIQARIHLGLKAYDGSYTEQTVSSFFIDTYNIDEVSHGTAAQLITREISMQGEATFGSMNPGVWVEPRLVLHEIKDNGGLRIHTFQLGALSMSARLLHQ